jgi:TrkA domain protein
MVDVRETRLPGVGTKFTMKTTHDDRVSAVVHLDGMREIYHYADADDEPHVITMNDEEARQLGAILGGVVYRPQLVKDLEIVLKDLVMEWIELPATSRIRSTTGAMIVAVLRDSGSLAAPHPDEVLRADDTLVVIGRPESFVDISTLVREGPPAAAPTGGQ